MFWFFGGYFLLIRAFLSLRVVGLEVFLPVFCTEVYCLFETNIKCNNDIISIIRVFVHKVVDELFWTLELCQVI